MGGVAEGATAVTHTESFLSAQAAQKEKQPAAAKKAQIKLATKTGKTTARLRRGNSSHNINPLAIAAMKHNAAAKSNRGLSAAGKAAEMDAESGRSGGGKGRSPSATSRSAASPPPTHTPREVKAKAGLTKAVLTKFYEEHDESKLSQIDIILDHPNLTPGLIHETCLDKYGSTPYGKYFSAMSTPQSPDEVRDNSVQGVIRGGGRMKRRMTEIISPQVQQHLQQKNAQEAAKRAQQDHDLALQRQQLQQERQQRKDSVCEAWDKKNRPRNTVDPAVRTAHAQRSSVDSSDGSFNYTVAPPPKPSTSPPPLLSPKSMLPLSGSQHHLIVRPPASVNPEDGEEGGGEDVFPGELSVSLNEPPKDPHRRTASTTAVNANGSKLSRVSLLSAKRRSKKQAAVKAALAAAEAAKAATEAAKSGGRGGDVGVMSPNSLRLSIAEDRRKVGALKDKSNITLGTGGGTGNGTDQDSAPPGTEEWLQKIRSSKSGSVYRSLEGRDGQSPRNASPPMQAAAAASGAAAAKAALRHEHIVRSAHGNAHGNRPASGELPPAPPPVLKGVTRTYVPIARRKTKGKIPSRPPPSGPPPPPGPPIPHQFPTVTTATAQQLEAFYQHVDPSKIPVIPDILSKFGGNEEKLFAQLEKKYPQHAHRLKRGGGGGGGGQSVEEKRPSSMYSERMVSMEEMGSPEEPIPLLRPLSVYSERMVSVEEMGSPQEPMPLIDSARKEMPDISSSKKVFVNPMMAMSQESDDDGRGGKGGSTVIEFDSFGQPVKKSAHVNPVPDMPPRPKGSNGTKGTKGRNAATSPPPLPPPPEWAKGFGSLPEKERQEERRKGGQSLFDDDANGGSASAFVNPLLGGGGGEAKQAKQTTGMTETKGGERKANRRGEWADEHYVPTPSTTGRTMVAVQEALDVLLVLGTAASSAVSTPAAVEASSVRSPMSCRLSGGGQHGGGDERTARVATMGDTVADNEGNQIGDELARLRLENSQLKAEKGQRERRVGGGVDALGASSAFGARGGRRRDTVTFGPFGALGIDAVDGFRTPAAPLPLWATQGFTTTTTTSTAGEGKAGGERGQRRLAYTEPRNTTDDRGMSGAPILTTKNKPRAWRTPAPRQPAPTHLVSRENPSTMNFTPSTAIVLGGTGTTFRPEGTDGLTSYTPGLTSTPQYRPSSTPASARMVSNRCRVPGIPRSSIMQSAHQQRRAPQSTAGMPFTVVDSSSAHAVNSSTSSASTPAVKSLRDLRSLRDLPTPPKKQPHGPPQGPPQVPATRRGEGWGVAEVGERGEGGETGHSVRIHRSGSIDITHGFRATATGGAATRSDATPFVDFEAERKAMERQQQDMRVLMFGSLDTHMDTYMDAHVQKDAGEVAGDEEFKAARGYDEDYDDNASRHPHHHNSHHQNSHHDSHHTQHRGQRGQSGQSGLGSGQVDEVQRADSAGGHVDHRQPDEGMRNLQARAAVSVGNAGR